MPVSQELLYIRITDIKDLVISDHACASLKLLRKKKMKKEVLQLSYVHLQLILIRLKELNDGKGARITELRKQIDEEMRKEEEEM